jgi:NADH-quinone oxidoreductase subunit M
MFQELTNKKWLDLKDLNLRELVTLVPLAAAALFIGLYPAPLLEMLHAPTQSILAQVQPYLADNQSILQLAGSFLGGF